MLRIERRKYYQVKVGQNLRAIAEYFSVSEWLLVKENDLKGEPSVGQILKIPSEYGHAYIVQAGDTKALLCGGEENYRRKNGTDIFYIGMRVILWKMTLIAYIDSTYFAKNAYDIVSKEYAKAEDPEIRR